MTYSWTENPHDETEDLDLGPCCGCGEDDNTVNTIVCLDKEALIEGTGWGCFVCGLPMNGALAVLCDLCIAEGRPARWAILGYPKDKRRCGIQDLSREFKHNMELYEAEELENWTLPYEDSDRIIEVHNAYTIYGIERDGSEAERPMAQLSRPQDWGDPRWHYERFEFRWHSDKLYINHAHCWTDLKLEKHEYPQLFAPLISQISMPGRTPELCGNRYLDDEDFWSEEWGPMPPYYDEEEEEDF